MAPVSAVVRPLTAQDTDAFLAIRRAALQTDPDAFEATLDTDEALDPALARSRLRVSSLERGDFILGAFSPGLIGIIGISPYRPDPTAVLWLWGFYVAPEFRGAGVGRSLLLEAVRIGAAASGFKRLDLRVSPQSVAAIALYEYAGFTRSAEPAPAPPGNTIPMTLSLRVGAP